MIVVTATDLPRMMQCTGSRLMATIMPADASTDARDEGNAADWLAGQIFTNSGDIQTYVGTKAPNGFVITADMLNFVSEYLSALDCGEMQVETSWSGGNGAFEIRGRADHIVLLHADEHQSHVVIDEFKYGWRVVEPFMNWTLISHAIGFMVTRNVRPARFTFRIHQPRPLHPDGTLRVWSIDAETINALWLQIIDRLSNPTDMLQTGPECYKCHAYLGCPAADKMQANAIDASYDSIFSHQLTGEQLSRELDLLTRAQAVIKTRLEAFTELAVHRSKNGEIVPNYATDPQYGNSTWKPFVTPELIKATTGLDASKPGLVTPAEMKRRGMSETAVKSLSERPMKGVKLRRIDADARARKMLGKQ